MFDINDCPELTVESLDSIVRYQELKFNHFLRSSYRKNGSIELHRYAIPIPISTERMMATAQYNSTSANIKYVDIPRTMELASTADLPQRFTHGVVSILYKINQVYSTELLAEYLVRFRPADIYQQSFLYFAGISSKADSSAARRFSDFICQFASMYHGQAFDRNLRFGVLGARCHSLGDLSYKNFDRAFIGKDLRDIRLIIFDDVDFNSGDCFENLLHLLSRCPNALILSLNSEVNDSRAYTLERFLERSFFSSNKCDDIWANDTDDTQIEEEIND